MALEWMDIVMLARTHGQPATPTRVGKELMVFVERLKVQLKLLETIPFSAKFGGATGGLNAHVVAYPKINWLQFADDFVQKKLGLVREQFTTQIGHYDDVAALCDNLKRINTILLDFSKDMWTYISLDYFRQTVVDNEVGSSAMPHKGEATTCFFFFLVLQKKRNQAFDSIYTPFFFVLFVSF
jgi:adenylosuccinate lyase